MTGMKIEMVGASNTLAKIVIDSNSRNELTKAKKEMTSKKMRQSAEKGTNATLIRMAMSWRARLRLGIDDIIVNMVKMIEATTSEVCKIASFDSIGPCLGKGVYFKLVL
jgi:hypothetical protein